MTNFTLIISNRNRFGDDVGDRVWSEVFNLANTLAFLGVVTLFSNVQRFEKGQPSFYHWQSKLDFIMPDDKKTQFEVELEKFKQTLHYNFYVDKFIEMDYNHMCRVTNLGVKTND